jgi:hypothetical protein
MSGERATRTIGQWMGVMAAAALIAGCGDPGITAASRGGAASPVAPRRTMTLSVSITGRTKIPSNQFCSFKAWVSGGTAPYTYAWSQSQGLGFDVDQQEYWSKSGFAYSVSVQVIDANGNTGSAMMYVQVGSSPTCNV